MKVYGRNGTMYGIPHLRETSHSWIDNFKVLKNLAGVYFTISWIEITEKKNPKFYTEYLLSSKSYWTIIKRNVLRNGPIQFNPICIY